MRQTGQANFTNVLKFHSGVPLSPLCCVLEPSEFPRSIYFWKTLHVDVFKNQVSEHPCLIIFLECCPICDGLGFFASFWGFV